MVIKQATVIVPVKKHYDRSLQEPVNDEGAHCSRGLEGAPSAVQKVSRTSKVRAALEVGYIWNGHPEKAPKCERGGVMNWIYSEAEWTWEIVPLWKQRYQA